VWRFREFLPTIPDAHIVWRPEGTTNLYGVGASEKGGFRLIGEYAGLDHLYLKHEGENPTGSFKDRGMTVGVSQAVALGARAVACASTGNTSASLASYAAQAGLPCFVFVPEGKISSGKLAQTLAFGAVTLQVRGDFDAAMELVQEVCASLGIYLLNSINPFRIEGQKTIALEMLQQMGWEPPDWIVLPAGNLGNTAALGKALLEAQEAGLIDKLPRLAAVQAEGADPFYRSFMSGFTQRFTVAADTVASAIKIGNPVSYERAGRVIRATNGLVTEVSDAAILEAKAVIDRAGIGCEPASAAALAGARKLAASGAIGRDERVTAVLTGHILKDADTTFSYHMGATRTEDARPPYANAPLQVRGELDEVRRALESYL
jgi:threonine synthase